MCSYGDKPEDRKHREKYKNYEIKEAESFKDLGNKTVTNGNVKTEITERIKNSQRTYSGNATYLRTGKYAHLKNYYIPILT
jgi:hypothetical protein